MGPSHHATGHHLHHAIATFPQILSLVIADYAATLKQARRIGGLAALVPGVRSMTDPVQKGNLRLYEEIIGCAFYCRARSLSADNTAKCSAVHKNIILQATGMLVHTSIAAVV